MNQPDKTFFIATRGSALALAQAQTILAQCQTAFPHRVFEIKIFKTTGDKLQTASLANEAGTLPKGLFTRELELALLNGEADLAVHSLKDLPTELPPGLCLGAIGEREDPRDVLIYRDATVVEGSSTGRGFAKNLGIQDLPRNAVIGTSSTRRKALLLAQRGDLQIKEHRGNVLTRIEKLKANPKLDAIVLAAAGLNRLNFSIGRNGGFTGREVPSGLLAVAITPEIMMPCVGQGAIGLEIRDGDVETQTICDRLNHAATAICVKAERAFLAAMGGGCQSPVAAYGELNGDLLWLRAVSFQTGAAKRAEGKAPTAQALELGRELAAKLK